MMTAVLAAAWMGFLCAASPCPMAANLAAVGFLARQVESPHRVLFSGLAYGLGRITTYVLLALALVTGLLSSPALSQALQKYADRIAAPLMILVAIVLLDLVPFKLPQFGGSSSRLGMRLVAAGFPGAYAVGVLFALALCPPSAALYFGGLVPLATEHASPVLLPLVFGTATALPVVACAAIIAYSAHGLGRFCDALAKVGGVFRLVTGVALLVYGLIRCCQSIFGW